MRCRRTRSARVPRTRRARPQEAFDRRLIAPLVLGAVLNPLNSSIVAVSLVPIGEALGALPSQTAWLVSALYLAAAVGQPVAGWLIDVHGPRRLFLLGAGLVGFAGLLGVLAPNLGILIVARILLGLGTCAGYPAAMHLIASEAERTGRDSPGRVLTLLAIAGQSVSVVGPTLGGLLIGLGGWRATFAINIPLAAACLALGALRLPKASRFEHPADDRRPARPDLSGMTLFAATLLALLLFLMSPRAAHWYLPVLAGAAAVALTIRELRATKPFIDLRMLRGNIPLLATYLRNLLATAVCYCFLYGYAQWLGEGRGLSAPAVGLLLLPLFLAAVTASALSGRRKGAVRGQLVLGGIAQLAACALLLLIDSASALWLLLAVAAVMGVSQGLTGLAVQSAMYYQADRERLGSSAGLLRTSTYVGAMSSAAATAAFYGAGADTGALHRLALFMLAVAALSLVVTLLDRSLGRLGTRPKGP
ncbi:MFS transporter [Streptomyces sp. NBC_00690]|uniref:MFS transporter n=1 Tax=Streptomyces sp. NBC_00690 TaxID=2975808 RepID=UPI002E293533|nr:MFS transporter [Streptomyces sp. NBC_00690]